MFEKKAEEYIDKVTRDWSDGAYSFSVEELRQAILHFAEFGYNKANEWHYPSKGEYPKDNKPVLCILGDINSDNCEVGYYNDVGSGEPWHFETYHLPDDSKDDYGVSAWKEIVLPELKESE